MSELCPDCGHVAGVSEDRCGAALERFLGAEPNQQYRALCKLRSRIAQLEAANAKLVELCEEYEAQWGDDYLARKWGLKEALAETRAELERVKAT